MSKNKLYTIVFIACFFGFIYLFFKIHYSQSAEIDVCLIKNITGYACPSCGTSLAVSHFFHGKFTESLLANPFGIIVVLLMLISPIWILFDVITKKETFFIWYQKAEKMIRNKWIAIPLIILVILNWIWNLYKGL